MSYRIMYNNESRPFASNLRADSKYKISITLKMTIDSYIPIENFERQFRVCPTSDDDYPHISGKIAMCET